MSSNRENIQPLDNSNSRLPTKREVSSSTKSVTKRKESAKPLLAGGGAYASKLSTGTRLQAKKQSLAGKQQ
jgi:hypothetical protein